LARVYLNIVVEKKCFEPKIFEFKLNAQKAMKIIDPFFLLGLFAQKS